MASVVQRHQPRVLRKYDIQIVQEAIKYLCKDEDMFETIEDIQNEVERRIGRTIRSPMLPLFKSFPDNFDLEEKWRSSKIKAKTRLELCPSHCGKQRNCDHQTHARPAEDVNMVTTSYLVITENYYENITWAN
jgi:hypothetical protein